MCEFWFFSSFSVIVFSRIISVGRGAWISDPYNRKNNIADITVEQTNYPEQP